MAHKPTDVRVVAVEVYFLEAAMRVPLKFAAETTSSGSEVRVRLTVADAAGRRAEGWGETPLAVAWTWPGGLSVAERDAAMRSFCLILAEAWAKFERSGHPMEVGWEFLQTRLPALLGRLNADRPGKPMPHLSALLCCSAFDIALHDAYGNLHGVDIYRTYNGRFMNADLSAFLTPADGADVRFAGRHPEEFWSCPARGGSPPGTWWGGRTRWRRPS